MKMTNMMLMSDFYKQGHSGLYPKGLDYLFTCGTPRMSRIDGMEKMVVFGPQAFAMDYLIERFNDSFFHRPKAEAVKEVADFIKETFKSTSFSIKKIEDLHDLGYLPVRMWALPEGTVVPIYSQKDNPGVVQVPFVAFENTHPDFAWVAEFLESITSAQLWYPCLIATITKFGYRDIVDCHWAKSVEDNTQPAHTAISEFGFRGAEGSEGAILASSAFLTCFDKTATVPAIKYIKDYYGDGIGLGEIGSGMPSTEHSVMCSNFAVDGENEDTFMIRLFKELETEGNVSVVSDSYDYWNRVKVICDPESEVHKAILNRNGTVYVRGDSGDPVAIIAGTNKYRLINDLHEIGDMMDEMDIMGAAGSWFFKLYQGDNKPFVYYRVDKEFGKPCKPAIEVIPDIEDIGTIEAMFNGFGGHRNSKGFIILDNHVRGIYGDSITPMKADRMYGTLEVGGYAANNVALGAGSFSMQAWEELDKNTGKMVLKPHTRDTFGIAFKATYCEVDGKPYQVFKQPKTDTGFKRSQRGMVVVYRDENGDLRAMDHLNKKEFMENLDKNIMRPIFENGKMVYVDNIREIRSRLNNHKF